MASAWRIVRAARVSTAFTGEGSRFRPGRWNSRGKAVIYLSEHESLAALEILVHTKPLTPTARYFAFRVAWPDELTECFPRSKLPSGWNAQPPGIASRAIGDQWLTEGRSVALAVPSLLSTTEVNFLLNPDHADFNKIKISKPVEYLFDRRLHTR
jgi:RES domain-containing protein